MHERLQQFLSAENLSQSQFADSIGVARASISHILNGRNKPGFDFIANMSRHFPTLNIEWLITGKGRMYKDQQSSPIFQKTEPEPSPAPSEDLFSQETEFQQSVPEPEPSPKAVLEVKKTSNLKSRTILKIVVFYDDNTYEELK